MTSPSVGEGRLSRSDHLGYIHGFWSEVRQNRLGSLKAMHNTWFESNELQQGVENA